MKLRLSRLFIFILICFNPLFSFITDKKIHILGLFGSDEQEEQFSFQRTVDEINEDYQYAFNLQANFEELQRYDSYNISRTICRKTSMGDGIGVIFGPDFDEVTGIVQSISDSLHIPHIDTRWDTLSRNTSEFYINLYPDSSLLATAIYQVLDDMDWETFTLIYESKENLVHVQEVLKAKLRRSPYNRPTITMKELPQNIQDYKKMNYQPQGTVKIWSIEFGYITVKFLQTRIISLHQRPFLKEIKLSLETRIMLHCNPDKIMEILNEAKEVDLMGSYQRFFITSLDAHTINYEEFAIGKSNITMLRLINPENELVTSFVENWNKVATEDLHINASVIKTDTALMQDAVKLFAETIQHLIYNVTTRPIRCVEIPRPWNMGSTIIKKMRNSHFEGVSGSMRFDVSTGKRTYFTLDIIQLISEGFRILGIWDPENGVRHMRNISQLEEESLLSIEGKKLRVVTKTGLPYLALVNNDTLTGNDRFVGYSKDLMEMIAKELHFTYTMEIVRGESQGNLNEKTGKWDGLIGELRELRADLAICDFTITSERQKVIDFTASFMTLGIAILHSKPPPNPPTYFSFLDPFSFMVWSYLATCYLCLSIALFVIARCSPYEWEGAHPCNQEPEELENAMNLKTCLWFSLGSVLQQGCDILPKAWSTRLTASMWWFFTLIVTSTYTANLAAFLTTKRLDSPIKDVKDLANQDKIKYGCYINGSTASFFKMSNDSLYQRMWANMESQNPSAFTDSNKAGVERVLNSKNKYAFFMESSTIEYEKNQNCKLVQVGDVLDNKKYGIGLPHNSHYKKALNIAILRFQEDGRLKKLKENWWRNPHQNCEEAKDEDKDKLRLANVGGVFVLLILGCILAFFISTLEFLWNVRKVAVIEKITLSEAFWLELKFAFRCRGTTKPVRHTPQSGMIGTPLSVSQTGFDKFINRTQ